MPLKIFQNIKDLVFCYKYNYEAHGFMINKRSFMVLNINDFIQK